jgi:hypothetical protein
MSHKPVKGEMDFAVICMFVELCINFWLDVVENNNFFLRLSGFATERGELLVASVDEVVKVGPDLVLSLGFEGLIRLTYILIEIEIVGIDN